MDDGVSFAFIYWAQICVCGNWHAMNQSDWIISHSDYL